MTNFISGGIAVLFGLGILFPVPAQDAPRVVAIPPSDAYIGFSKLTKGEIRHYNYGEQHEPGNLYIATVDGGTTWTKTLLPDSLFFADNRNPLTGTMIRLFYENNAGWCVRYSETENGTTELIKGTDKPLIMLKPPVLIDGSKRVVVAPP